MFGLFKKKTGSEQFSKEITNAFEKLVEKVFKDYGHDNMLGAMVMMAFDNAKKGWIVKSNKFAKDYEISETEVVNIIEKSSAVVFNKYFQ